MHHTIVAESYGVGECHWVFLRVAFHLVEPTGVNAVEADGRHTLGITNLLGQKINRIEVPGVYIIDGKKVLIKTIKQKNYVE